jgi:hypothetical protein
LHLQEKSDTFLGGGAFYFHRAGTAIVENFQIKDFYKEKIYESFFRCLVVRSASALLAKSILKKCQGKKNAKNLQMMSSENERTTIPPASGIIKGRNWFKFSGKRLIYAY